ncbi:CDGSH iron-sulfur domain-containing protein [Ornithinimicrobium sufpigmenti]|uniref:CDGSH iron-sulfur domain-containing protein n=1 Tax=Ornithinimicrobium sufpigmenti TaxID=2508882 RepID=UPI001036BB6C|nr:MULTISPECIES: CDGSH iron-sulfur domain-containing protein [unclassified Ornithinimicrobium]
MRGDRVPVATPLPTELLRLTECEDGPVLVRGARVVVDAQGVTHPVTRPVVALCRCGASQRLPWCDGVHKRLGKRETSTG